MQVGRGPTGVAVDRAGKVWVSNLSSNTLSRINPSLNNNVGAVDLTVDLMGYSEDDCRPYNYGDMTGRANFAAPKTGTWTLKYCYGCVVTDWGQINWAADTPSDSSLTVEFRTQTTDPWTTVSNGQMLSGFTGQCLDVRVSFKRATNNSACPSTGESPVLYDLSITLNQCTCESVGSVCHLQGGQMGCCDSNQGCIPLGPAPAKCLCVNDQSVLSVQDTGCNSTLPNCDADEGMTGVSCFLCRNDKPPGTTDSGCGCATPNCKAGEGKTGLSCYFCINNNPFGTRDDGCNDPAKPNCKAADQGEGTQCYFCKNDNPFGTKDDGCNDPKKPNCKAPAGGEGTECYASCKFSISKSFSGPNIGVEILVEPLDDGGVMFKVTEADAILRGDLRGVFFHLTVDPSKVTAIVGKDVTSFQKGPANSVVSLGNGANMQGNGGKHKYDIGVQIGTQGIGKDDIGETSFIVKGITLDDIDFSQEFGVRLTSVGVPPNRGGSSKVFGLSGYGSDAGASETYSEYYRANENSGTSK